MEVWSERRQRAGPALKQLANGTLRRQCLGDGLPLQLFSCFEHDGQGCIWLHLQLDLALFSTVWSTSQETARVWAQRA